MDRGPSSFRCASVIPQIDVISDPEYVVGTATSGSPVSRAMALPSPIDEPPPIATHTSALAARALLERAFTTSTGTCSTAPSNSRGESGAEQRLQRRKRRETSRRRDDERALGRQSMQLGGKLGERVRREHDAGGAQLVDERRDRRRASSLGRGEHGVERLLNERDLVVVHEVSHARVEPARDRRAHSPKHLFALEHARCGNVRVDVAAPEEHRARHRARRRMSSHVVPGGPISPPLNTITPPYARG